MYHHVTPGKMPEYVCSIFLDKHLTPCTNRVGIPKNWPLTRVLKIYIYIYMSKFTKLSLSLGGALALLTLAGQSVFAANTPNTANGYTTSGKAKWNAVAGAKYYNIYYKEAGDKKFTHSVRRLPQNTTSYTISSLKNGVTYWYDVSALNEAGKEFGWVGLNKLGK